MCVCVSYTVHACTSLSTKLQQQRLDFDLNFVLYLLNSSLIRIDCWFIIIVIIVVYVRDS